jgi:hypothetical protein
MGLPMPAEQIPRTERLALLIDADNISAEYLPLIVREASALGTTTVKRVYGNFASTSTNAWHPLVHEHALTPVHIPPAATGKNASDMKLVIEAMDLLHRGQIEGFCIASSDSDFTTLASRIREDGVRVFGFGEEKATKAYINSFDRFFYCDLLLREEKSVGLAKPTRTPALPMKQILAAIDDVSGEDKWAHLGEVGAILGKRMPDFDPRNFGHKKLSDLIQSIDSLDVQRTKAGTGTLVQVRRK